MQHEAVWGNSLNKTALCYPCSKESEFVSEPVPYNVDPWQQPAEDGGLGSPYSVSDDSEYCKQFAAHNEFIDV